MSNYIQKSLGTTESVGVGLEIASLKDALAASRKEAEELKWAITRWKKEEELWKTELAARDKVIERMKTFIAEEGHSCDCNLDRTSGCVEDNFLASLAKEENS